MTPEELLYQLEESIQQRLGNKEPVFTTSEFKIASKFMEILDPKLNCEHDMDFILRKSCTKCGVNY